MATASRCRVTVPPPFGNAASNASTDRIDPDTSAPGTRTASPTSRPSSPATDPNASGPNGNALNASPNGARPGRRTLGAPRASSTRRLFNRSSTCSSGTPNDSVAPPSTSAENSNCPTPPADSVTRRNTGSPAQPGATPANTPTTTSPNDTTPNRMTTALRRPPSCRKPHPPRHLNVLAPPPRHARTAP